MDKEKEMAAASTSLKNLNESLRAEQKQKEEVSLSNSSLEDRIQKLEMERE